MINKETTLRVADNSGAKSVKCFGFYRGKRCARIGDVIKVSVKTIYPGSSIKRKVIYKAIVLSTKQSVQSHFIRYKFHDNFVAMLDNSGRVIGNRIGCSSIKSIKNKCPSAYSYISKVY